MNLEKILKDTKAFSDLYDIDESVIDKIIIEKNDEPMPGAIVSIYWMEREFPDKGYLFKLPETHDSYLDMIVHVPAMENSVGGETGKEAYIHLYTLLTYKNVETVEIKNQKYN